MKRFIYILMIAALFINFALPKAGTKWGDTPIYASILLAMVILLPLVLIEFIKHIREREELITAVAVMSCLAVILIQYFVYPSNQGFLKTIFTQLPQILPMVLIVFVYLFKYYPLDLRKFRMIVFISFAVITLYGFIQKLFGDMNTVIPGITYNYADAMKFYGQKASYLWEKHNFIQSLQYLKLSSTYQNGNLFGINYILLFWFVFYFLKTGGKKIYKIILPIALSAYVIICVLTASGTVYIGLFISLILLYAYEIFLMTKLNAEEKKRKQILYIAIPAAVLVLITAVYFILQHFWAASLFNGNRMKGLMFRGISMSDYFQYLIDKKNVFAVLFGSLLDPFRKGSGYEITLLAIFSNVGIIILGFYSYLMVQLIRKMRWGYYSIGLIAYALASFIDGAFWLHPTAFNFFVFMSAAIYMIHPDKKNNPAS